MFTAFVLSIAQLGDRAVLGVLAKSLAVTFALFVLLGAGVWWGVNALLATWTYHGALASAASLVVTILALWLLFRAVAVAVVGLFADTIVVAVEREHYPAALSTARDVPFGRSLRMALASAGRFIAVNLMLAPLYLVLLATGIGTAALFLAANAWLLGRDLGDMVSARHLPPEAMRDWRQATAARRFLLGLAVTILFLAPFANILAPVIGAALATHVYHRSRS
ncbi:Etoposide-induced protein 2.4 (EI24) [Sphingomonas sp. OV641]|uniref:EI24 domain-containing protein n=1 Tax=Sphingomonas sp. OV641 TaxID=1881068 RepID=UPI0008BE6E4C|nr:EI24 domain-containing protein [Sphingomonas sp. OV641]SEJ80105.1 Etoposide-induced protein 2.4 (EI24) [Sphingomonas sp. OV641]